MAKEKGMELEQMSMGEIDELERKLAELKKQKMKEEKAEVIKKVRKLCMDYKISATQLRGALTTRDRKKKKTKINENNLI
jgi:hypothetical protein